MKKINMAQARAKFPELIKRVQEGESVVVGRYSMPVAVIVSYEKFVEMEEDLEDLHSALRAVLEARAEQKPGRTLDEVMADSAVSSKR